MTLPNDIIENQTNILLMKNDESSITEEVSKKSIEQEQPEKLHIQKPQDNIELEQLKELQQLKNELLYRVE